MKQNRHFFRQYPAFPYKWLATLLMLCVACFLPTGLLALDQGISANNGWIRATPPGSQNAAAFVTLENHSKTPRKLVAVQCETSVAARCELHEHITIDGRMRMQKVESIEIPAGGKLQFAPGGLHIMLISLTAPLAAGSTVGITFTLADQVTFSAQLPVKAITQE